MIRRASLFTAVIGIAMLLGVSVASAQPEIVFKSDLPELQAAYDAAATDTERAEAGYRLGVRLLDHGDASGAIEVWSRALGIRKRQADANPDNIDALDNLFQLHLDIGDASLVLADLSAAEAHYHAAQQVAEIQSERDEASLEWTAFFIAHEWRFKALQIASGKITKAAIEQVATLQVLESLFAEPSPTVPLFETYMVAAGRVGDLLVAIGQSQDASLLYEQSYSIADTLSGRGHITNFLLDNYAFAYERLGRQAKAQNNLDLAIVAYRAARDMRETLSSEATNSVQAFRRWIDTLLVLGDLQLTEGNAEAALENFNKALGLANQLEDLNDTFPSVRYGPTEQTYLIHNVLMSGPSLEKMFAAESEPRTLFRRLSTGDPTDVGWSYDLIRTHEKIGELHEQVGNLDEALVHYRAYLALVQKLAKERPDSTERTFEVSRPYQLIGRILAAKGDLGPAIASYQNAIDIRQRMVDDTASPIQMRFLSNSLEEVANLYAEANNFDAAAENFAASLALDKEVTGSRPLGPTEYYQRGKKLHDAARNLIKGGTPADALPYLREALEINESLVLLDPTNPELHRLVTNSMFYLAQVPESGTTHDDFLDRMESLYREGLLIEDDEHYLREHRPSVFKQ